MPPPSAKRERSHGRAERPRTPSDTWRLRQQRPRQSRWLLLVPVLALVFAASLLAASVPRLLAAAEVAEYGRIGQRLGRGELDGRQLAKALADHRDALDWFDTGEYRGNLGQVYFAAARFYVDDTKRRLALVDRAATLDIEALKRDPGQPFLWSQLAVALAQTRGLGEDFRKVLKQAVLAAPRTPPLVFVRADLGIRAWPRLDPEMRALIKEQVIQAARIDPRRLRRTLPGPNHRLLVRHLLAEDPALVERFLRY